VSKKLPALAVAVALGVGFASGFGFVSGTARWLLANPVAAVVLGIVAWLVFVLVKPYRTCRWCKKGTRLAKLIKKLPGRRRCPRCKGQKLTRRLGAYHVHKVKLSLRQAWDERGSD